MATVTFSNPTERANKAHFKTGCGCAYCSPCYFDFPDCIGCDCVSSCLFFDTRSKCSIFEQSCQQTCCKSCTYVKLIQSCCCLVMAFAIPCDAEVPFTLGVCGFMCVDGFSSKDAVVAAAGAVTSAVTPTKAAES